MINKMFIMLGLDKTISITAARRRRRSISGSSGTDVTTISANEDTDFIAKQINLQFNTVSTSINELVKIHCRCWAREAKIDGMESN